MLRIRHEQLKVFQPVTEAAFEERVIEYLRAEHAEAVVELSTGTVTLAELPDEPLRQTVRARLERARAYGMTWESTLTSFVALTFVVAEHFDDQPAIHRVLSDDQIEPDLRIDQLWEQTTDEAAIIKRLDEAWWISRENVAREIVGELSLAEIRSLSAATRLRLEHELAGGYVSEADKDAMERINQALKV